MACNYGIYGRDSLLSKKTNSSDKATGECFDAETGSRYFRLALVSDVVSHPFFDETRQVRDDLTI